MIDFSTLGIFPNYSNKGEVVGSVIYDSKQEKRTSHVSATLFIREFCKVYAEGFNTLQKNSSRILENQKKLPIVIQRGKPVPVILVPTLSPDNIQTAWFSLLQYLSHEPVGSKQTRIHFQNGEAILLEVNSRSLDTQIAKAFSLYQHYKVRYGTTFFT